GGESSKFGIRQDAARGAWLARKEFDRHATLTARALGLLGRLADVADECGAATPQSRFALRRHGHLVASPRCPHRLLAPDDLGGELHVGFAADALEVVDQHWLA